MYILLIHQSFVKPDEGGGTRHYEMCRYLVRFGYHVSIISSQIIYLSGEKRAVSEEITDGIKIYYTKAYSQIHKSILHRAFNALSFAISSFLRGLKLVEVELIWGTSPPLFQAFTSLILAKIKKVPYIFEVRDLWLDFARELGLVTNPVTQFLFKKIERFIYIHANAVVVNSPGFIPYISKYIPKSKIKVFVNGVEMNGFKQIDDNVINIYRKKYNLKNKFVVLYAGNIGVANDIENILNASRFLKFEFPEIVFVLFGGGLSMDKYREICRKDSLTNVHFFESQPKKEIPYILSMADVCLATLKDIELFKTTYPNKVFDYMAAGRPTVLAIDGVIRDVIKKANAGIFVEPGNAENLAVAIKYYFLNRHMIFKHGNNGRNYVRKYFDRKKITEQFASFIENISNYSN
jgi:glycosyltransferase involved in cell wall biosynthesis